MFCQGRSLVFMPKNPVTSVGGSRQAVRIDSVNSRRLVTSVILAAISSSNSRARSYSEPTSLSMASSFCASARMACATGAVIGRQARLDAVEHAAQLRQLPVHAHRLQADAADTRAVVGRFVAHDKVLDAVELVAEPFGHAAHGIGELIMTASSSDPRWGSACRPRAAAVDFDRMNRRAAHADEPALAHDETQAHDGVGVLRKLLLQVGHRADDLVAEDVQTQMLLGPSRFRARARTGERSARSRRGSACRRATGTQVQPTGSASARATASAVPGEAVARALADPVGWTWVHLVARRHALPRLDRAERSPLSELARETLARGRRSTASGRPSATRSSAWCPTCSRRFRNTPTPSGAPAFRP